MATPATRKYSSLECSVCLEDPHKTAPTVSHTWHGHVVIQNPGKPDEKRIIHGGCEECWPSVPIANRSQCHFCREPFPRNMAGVFLVKPDGTLDTSASTTFADVEEPHHRAPGSALLRSRAVSLQIAIPPREQVVDQPRPCNPVVTGISAAAITASAVAFVVTAIVCPPAIVITAPIIFFTTLVAVPVIAVEALGPTRSDGGGRNSPVSPDSPY